MVPIFFFIYLSLGFCLYRMGILFPDCKVVVKIKIMYESV